MSVTGSTAEVEQVTRPGPRQRPAGGAGGAGGGRRVRAAVAGGTGYAGAELLALLLEHPQVEVVAVASASRAGRPVGEVLPRFAHVRDWVFAPLVPEELAAGSEVVILAVPHGEAMGLAPRCLAAGARVVDLSADFRLRRAADYEEWYGTSHVAPWLLEEAAYGLPELFGHEVARARLVASPGCYPTAVLLALAPLLVHRWVEPGSLCVTAASGVSGAGAAPRAGYHFPEMTENLRPYGVPGHRHTPEIEQGIARLAGWSHVPPVTFVPHLAPMSRGILVTAVGTPASGAPGGLQDGDLFELYTSFYRDAPFVRVLPPGQLPQTKAVAGSNFCDIAARWDGRSRRILAFAAIDNLRKGAAGQAVQNLNLMYGLDPGAGLGALPLYP